MCPILLQIKVTIDVALVATFVAVLWAAILLRRRAKEPWGSAFRRGLESSLTFGSRGSKPEADVSVPGSLGTIALALGIYGLVRQPVTLPVFGYAAMAFCGFAVTSFFGWFSGPKLGVEPPTAIRVAFLCAFFGILGSRAFHVVEFWDDEFADQPARVPITKDFAPAAGEDLQVRTRKGAAKAVFFGDEKTREQLFARLKPLEGAGVKAVPIVIDRRERDTVEKLYRGFMLETEDRGTAAELTVAGSALHQGPIAGVHGLTREWWSVFAIWQGGLVYYGGMIFGTLAVLVFVRVQGQRIAQVADLASSVGAIGVAFGRMGCFLNGCCWGRRAELPWSIRFPLHSPAWIQHASTQLGAEWDPQIYQRILPPPTELAPGLANALAAHDAEPLCHGSWALHPVQVYAILLDVGMFLVIFPFAMKKAKREWQTFFLWFVLYGVVRFVIEHFRADSDSFVWLFGYPLTPSQRVAVLTVPFAIAGLIWASKKGRPIEAWKPPAAPAKP